MLRTFSLEMGMGMNNSVMHMVWSQRASSADLRTVTLPSCRRQEAQASLAFARQEADSALAASQLENVAQVARIRHEADAQVAAIKVGTAEPAK